MSKLVQVKATDDELEEIGAQSVQPRTRGETANEGGGMFFSMVRAGELIPPWWSKMRDLELRRFWRSIDQLKGAMYNFSAKLKSIPFSVVPLDHAVKRHRRKAVEWDDKLHNEIELFNGWNMFIQKWIEDYVGTDNGAFFEIVGGPDDNLDKMMPLQGEVLTVANLDSAKCDRTNDPEFPVIYNAPQGGRHKLHFTRVAMASQMPAADEEMNNVGVCAVSRCVNAAQNLLDMSIYQQEKLGSRPTRALGVARGGLDPETIGKALQIAAETMDNRGQSRYAPVVIVGDKDIPDGDIDFKDLASLPDGFNQNDSTVIGMAIIALAFGVDARELFPAMGVGATRADALIQHIKQRGKGPADVLQTLEQQFNSRVLPPYLQIQFDFQDDAQDRQSAEISATRSDTRAKDLETGVTTIRVERERMLDDGEITLEQFVQLELDSGRMEDGTSVLALFQGGDTATIALLQMPGIDEPLLVAENDKEVVLTAISARRAELLPLLATENARMIKKAQHALAALGALERLYLAETEDIAEPEVAEDDIEGSTDEAMADTAVEDEEENMADDLDSEGDMVDETKKKV